MVYDVLLVIVWSAYLPMMRVPPPITMVLVDWVGEGVTCDDAALLLRLGMLGALVVVIVVLVVLGAGLLVGGGSFSFA